jgi:hypothetical protein
MCAEGVAPCESLSSLPSASGSRMVYMCTMPCSFMGEGIYSSVKSSKEPMWPYAIPAFWSNGLQVLSKRAQEGRCTAHKACGTHK